MSTDYDIPADIRAYLDQGAAHIRNKVKNATTIELVWMLALIWESFKPMRSLAELDGCIGTAAMAQAVSAQFAMVALMDEIYRREDAA